MLKELYHRCAALQRRPVMLFGGLGFVSGALSIALWRILATGWWMSPFVGVAFGLAICIALHLTAKPKWQSLAIAFLAVQLAWQAAMHTGFYVHREMREFTEMFLRPGSELWRYNLDMIPPGLIAGAVGAAGTWLGAAFCAAALRSCAAVALAVLTGTLAGLATVLGPFALYPIWQTAMAASLGFSVVARSNAGARASEVR